MLWERWAPEACGPSAWKGWCLAAVQLICGWKHQAWLRGDLLSPACSGIWGWESTASSEASGSARKRSVEEVQRKSMGQLGVLDAP